MVVAWAVATALSILGAIGAADRGIDQVDATQSRLSGSGITSPQTAGMLERARSDFATAKADLNAWWVVPLDVVPLAGRQVDAVRDLAGAAEQVAGTGAGTLTKARRLLQAPDPGGMARVTLLEQLSRLARSSGRQLDRVQVGPSGDLLGPISSRHHRFADQLDRARSELANVAAGAAAAATILEGPQRYLVLMANNAEMRAGSGAFLEAGILSTSDGTLTMSDVQPTEDLNLTPGEVPVSGDLEARWGWLLPGVDWRNIGVTPQFDVNGPLAAAMWHAATGQVVDGVLAVDVAALQQVLGVTGPVVVGTSTVTAQNVEQLLMHDQYVGLSYGGSQAELARLEELGSLAQSTFQALEDRSVDLHALALAVADAADGRHLLLWSSSPSQESTWVSLGVAGRLTGHSMDVDLINRGGNKLDQYMSLEVSLVPDRRHATAATLTVEIVNRTPPGQSAFVAGPYPGLGTVYGEYLGVLAVNLPAGVTPYVVGNPDLDALGAEGPTDLVGVPVDLRAGQSEKVVFDLRLPGRPLESTVVPSARIPPVTWDVSGASHSDGQPFSFRW